MENFLIKRNKNKKGFTLIELLVVMAILGLLATVGLNSFRSSQLKARDAQRKSDLEQVQRALEMYFNDYGVYPDNLSWGGELKDSKGTLYMKQLPTDPTSNPQYCYKTDDRRSYQLYAKLENSQDPKVNGPYSCGGCSSCYNYGVASPNSNP